MHPFSATGNALLESVRKCFGASEEQIDTLVLNFIDELPVVWREKFRDPMAA